MKGAYSAISSSNIKFKFDLRKFEQNNPLKYSNNSDNVISNKDEQKNTKVGKNENSVHDFSLLERNKLKKFINVDKYKENKIFSESNNSSNTIFRFSNPDRIKDREIDVENFNIHNQSPISVNSRNSFISRLTNRDFESPQKPHSGNDIFKRMKLNDNPDNEGNDLSEIEREGNFY